MPIIVRGPNIMPGYLRRADANAEAFDEEGFMRTGDLVRVEKHPRLGLEGGEEEAWIYVGMGTRLLGQAVGACADLLRNGRKRGLYRWRQACPRTYESLCLMACLATSH